MMPYRKGGKKLTPEVFKEAVERDFNIEVTEKMMHQFHMYFVKLVEWNQKMNLTAITQEEEVYLKHFYDSLTLLKAAPLKAAKTLCDVGAGAGFPSLPIKILLPDLEVTIVDSLNKRIQFLTQLVKDLELENVHLYHDRAETFGRKQREQFDIVTARAVARLNVLLELCTPLVKVDGYFIALKASQGREELSESKHAMDELSVQLIELEAFELPEVNDPRTLFVFKKMEKTKKKYPRKPGTPNKQPL